MVVSWAPFARLKLDTGQYHLRKLAALAPLAAASAFCFGVPYLARLAVMAAASAIFLALLSWRRAFDFKWSHALYEALLLSLLAPRELSWQMAWAAPTLSLSLRRLLGGREGMAPVNVPALTLGALAAHLGQGSESLGSWPAPWWFGPAVEQYFLCGALPAALSSLALALLLGGFLKRQLVVFFSLPAYFLSALWLYNAGGWGAAGGGMLVLLNALLVASFFLAHDELSTPRAGWAQAAQGLASVAVFLALYAGGRLYQAVVWSAFIPSLFSTWLDSSSAYRRWLPRFPSGPGIME
jgi:hypothetical protein